MKNVIILIMIGWICMLIKNEIERVGIMENIRERIRDYSNRVIELREESNNLYIEYKEKDLEERKESREDYYKELGKIDHRKKRMIDRIERLEERLGELEYIEL